MANRSIDSDARRRSAASPLHSLAGRRSSPTLGSTTHMQSIFHALKTGSGKERLAVVADIVSILGVSLATVLGGAFALNAKLDVENIAGVLIGGLFSLAGTFVIVALLFAVSSWLSTHLPANLPIRRLVLIALWLVFAALFLYAAFFAYVVLTSVQFVKP